jgi:divalent metal cation (Fe/Co/Zn/Cd) transporter
MRGSHSFLSKQTGHSTAKQKRKIASNIGSAALAADARQTDFCVYLSAILLIGLLLNALFGL